MSNFCNSSLKKKKNNHLYLNGAFQIRHLTGQLLILRTQKYRWASTSKCRLSAISEISICQGGDNDLKLLSIFHAQRETGTGAQLLWKINGAARCRDSGEGDQLMVLFTMLEEDKADVRGARDRHKQGCWFILACKITWQQWVQAARYDKMILHGGPNDTLCL